jgi:hypothetical protein
VLEDDMEDVNSVPAFWSSAQLLAHKLFTVTTMQVVSNQ